MQTLRRFSLGLESIPAITSWYLADIGEAKGRQALFTRQSPQRLKVLCEHALIESAVSSNRIEGVEVEQKRVDTIVFGHQHLRDRSEKEVRGYREALNLAQGSKLTISEKTIKNLHRPTCGGIRDTGIYKEKDSDIIEKHANGRTSVRFKTVPADTTPESMHEFIMLWRYDTLGFCSQGWHEGRHDPWPYVNFVCFILKDAYKEFEERLGTIRSPKGDKTAMILEAMEAIKGDFRVADLRKACPNVSIDLIRKVIKNLQTQGRIECLARGQKALWRKVVT